MNVSSYIKIIISTINIDIIWIGHYTWNNIIQNKREGDIYCRKAKRIDDIVKFTQT